MIVLLHHPSKHCESADVEIIIVWDQRTVRQDRSMEKLIPEMYNYIYR